MADNNKPSGTSMGDLIAMISFIGLCAAISTVVLQAAKDWTGNGLREITHYLGGAAFLCAPCFVGIVIAAFLINRRAR